MEDTNNIQQTVLPKLIEKLVFKELHYKIGHLRYERVIELCKDHFYWPSYKKNIRQYITKESKCLKDKKPNLVQRAPLETITTIQPFELITIDYLHLDQCKKNYKYLLVVVVHFPKFAQAFCTKTKCGRSATNTLFNKCFLDFQFPKRILHD